MRKTPFFFFLSFVLVLQIVSIQAQSFGPPIWMKEGVFVQYEFKSIGIIFQNRTSIHFEPKASVTWRWECTGLDDDLATLNVSINYIGEKKTLFLSKEIKVNTINRKVFLSNGTLIGTTHLWAVANPVDGEEIVVWDVPPDKIVAVVEIGEAWSNTPQGGQKIYDLNGKGQINDHDAYFRTSHDFDTGIMIDGVIANEATLYALDISSLLPDDRFLFTDTNIDLGPRELLPEILGLLPIILVIILFISVLVILYYRRRKRRRHS